MIGLTDKGEDRVSLESDGQGNIGNRTLMNFSFLGNPGSNTITDVSGNNIEGTLVNFNPDQNNGWTDEGIRFDGSNDYIRIPNTYREFWTPTEEITVNIRACADNWQTTENISLISCTGDGGWNVWLNSCNSGCAGIPGYLTLNIKVEGQPASFGNNPYHKVGILLSEIEPGFHTFTVTFDRRYSRIYMDGELKGSLDLKKYVDLQYSGYKNALIVGAEADYREVPEGLYFKGTISHVSIYDRCLHPDEVRRVDLETK